MKSHVSCNLKFNTMFVPFIKKSYWSLTSSKCLACATGFISNYFFAPNPTVTYWNPYTCYQVQDGTARWDTARSDCASKGTGVTTMIIRTSNEYQDALRFVDLFNTGFWV